MKRELEIQIRALGGDPDEVLRRVRKRTETTVWTLQEAFEYERDLLAMGSKPL